MNTIRRRYKGDPPLPWSSQGGPNMLLNNCQNSLKTHLRYIKITLKVNFLETKSGSGPYRFFFRWGQKKISRTSRENLNYGPPWKNPDYNILIRLCTLHRNSNIYNWIFYSISSQLWRRFTANCNVCLNFLITFSVIKSINTK